MKESILNGKRILVVLDESDVLEILEAEIREAAPDCRLDKATSYEKASQLMASFTYDLVILDIVGVRGYDLLRRAANRPSPFPVAMLTAHALSPEALKRSIELGAQAYLPRDEFGGIIPFLEEVMRHEHGPGCRRLLGQMKSSFNRMWLSLSRRPIPSGIWGDHSIALIESNRRNDMIRRNQNQ